MDTAKQKETSLRANRRTKLATTGTQLSVGQLEQALLSVFPASDAEQWDKTGMLVGDPTASVKGVAVALDPTIRAFEAAASVGANVLVTHHPLFLDPPEVFMPARIAGHNSGACVAYALRNDISCISYHTACDVARAALEILPSMLHLQPTHPLLPLSSDAQKGFGMVCTSPEQLTLKQLAARCVSVFSSMPRVWGPASAKLSRIATFGGSASSALEACLQQGVDCLVCGEVHYHDALNAAESGLCIIELGHDISELPLVALLASEVVSAGVDENKVTIVDQSENWYTPETIRR